MCRGREYVGTLYFPLNFAMNLKLLSETMKFFKIMDYFYN